MVRTWFACTSRPFPKMAKPTRPS
ncbi:UNVERIFIED_CONTAM: hypothetical protein GTU68_058893 [Idotea baltica]|nr:hypothetical protein [Idotea baltica]